MPDETTSAASSPAEQEDVFNGQELGMAEFTKYRETGELPERFKPAETVVTDAPEQTAEVTEDADPEIAPDPDPETQQQEPPQKVSPAQKRILQLLAEKKDLERKLAATAKTDVNPEPSTVQPSQQPQNYQEWFNTFDSDKWTEEYAKANPTHSYERMNAALQNVILDARDHFKTIAERVRIDSEALVRNVTEARMKYKDFDEITAPLVADLANPDGSPKVAKDAFDAINKSKYFTDLLYAIGGDAKTHEEFIRLAKSDPLEAVKQVGWYEGNIRSGLNQQGNVEEKAPVVTKTKAPKPPEPVTGGSSRAFDVSDESLSAEDWARKRTAQLAKKG